jgi:hypothetical protein
MSNDLKFIGLLIGVSVVLFWLLVLLPRKAAVPLSILAIFVTFYAIWVNVTDKGQPNQVDLGPYLRSIAALLALAGPVMALIFHLIGRRLWRWRLACFAAGFPLGYGLVWLYRQIDWFHDFSQTRRRKLQFLAASGLHGNWTPRRCSGCPERRTGETPR